MAGFELYTGEFLANPAPLELSMHYCSHKCAYCFANLQLPDRREDIPAIIRFLADLNERDTKPARLLKAGYPTVVSNRSDPFSTSNYKDALPILETMTALDLPIMLQTRGGRGVDRALEFLKPSAWYISIPFINAELQRSVEPGAPTVESRYELISKLRALGHSVVVGINPLVKEWLPPSDRDVLLRRLVDLGVFGAWIEPLHLNRKQVANLSDRERNAMGELIITRALKHHPDDVRAYYFETRHEARQAGLEVFSIGQYERSNFFDAWRKHYAHTFPNQQDFINWCHDHKRAGDTVTFAEFWSFVGGGLPAGVFTNMYQYFNQSRVGYLGHVPKDMTYRDACAIIWQEPQHRRNLLDVRCFALAARHGEALKDDQGLPVLAFVPDGQDEYVCEVA